MSRRPAVLLSMVLALSATPVLADGFEGDYAVTGELPDGRSYKGEARVIRTGQTLTIAWRIGGERHLGTAIEGGGSMSVVFAPQGGQPGIAVYRPSPDGKVVGVYTVLGGTETAMETWEKLPAAPKP